MAENGKQIKYDLEKRTAGFGENVINYCKKIEQNTITRPLISQLVRSSTSVGANYTEANGASSKKDFKNKIHICKKEVQESKHWLHMISVACPETKENARKLWKEAQELTLIFGKIISKLKN
ncbi:MAG: four helix bundle protein [Candidatus Moranbacteria bacterium]|nr:four helix bundle protein [Candidatus Moranbacteria bacterium]